MNLFVFVLMPFANQFNKRYDMAIKRAVQDAGMRAERVDKQSFHRQGITDRIINQIQDADVLIADMSTNNPNVCYEVGYAHATNKLCILLTNDPDTIPFDLKNRRHIVFSSLTDLRKKLRKDLEALKAEMDLSFDPTDVECIATVDALRYNIVRSQATSIRAKVMTSSELHHKNVSAQMTNIERRIGGRWKRFKLEQPLQLTWTDTGSTFTNIPAFTARYVNVFHIDHDENRVTIFGVSMPGALLPYVNRP